MSTALMRVLIVDDESAMLFSLSDYLTFRGCRVDCADSLADARALVHHLRYDVVIIGLHELNLAQGLRLAQETRQLSRTTRLVALTAQLAPLADERGNAVDFDQVIGRHLPLAHLARHLCRLTAA